MAWNLQGETGKAWDNTIVSMESRAVDAGQISFRSFDTDELTLTVIPEDFRTYTAPELGQIVRLYSDATLFFTGTVTDTQSSVSGGAQSLTITVSGPWWWMERVNYTSAQTDGTGASATRMTGVFGDATSGTNLKTAIETAIDTIAALGVPIANIAGGSAVATYFQVPRVTLNQGTCAFVITELCRLVPDTMVYFDYSTSTPTMQVTRRGVATTRTFTLGTSPVEAMNIRPVFEMKVDQVALPYVERDAIGRTKYNQQSSGTPATGRVQIITVSGPELDTFLPNDLFETQPVRTYATLEPFALASESQFKSAIDLGLANELQFPTASKTLWASVSAIGNSSSGTTRTLPAAVYTGLDGNPVSISGKVFLTPDNVNEWAISEYELIPVVATGQFWYDFLESITYYTAGGTFISETNFTIPEWYFALNFGGGQYNGYTGSRTAAEFRRLFLGTFEAAGYLAPAAYHWAGTARSGSGATTIILATDASTTDDFYIGRTVTWRKTGGSRFTDTITDYVGSTRAATLATSWSSTQRPASGDTYELDGHPLYRPADYSFIAPPANLAANLLAAQNFVPWEGDITISEQQAGGTRYRGCKVNVASSLTPHASMGALVSSETLDLKSGITAIELGTPPRVDYRTFVDRIRKTPQDNIVFDV